MLSLLGDSPEVCLQAAASDPALCEAWVQRVVEGAEGVEAGSDLPSLARAASVRNLHLGNDVIFVPSCVGPVGVAGGVGVVAIAVLLLEAEFSCTRAAWLHGPK